MRRQLAGQPRPAIVWPTPLRHVPLSVDNAPAVHHLLTQGSTAGSDSVDDFATWLSGFERDPECDQQLCIVITDAQGVVAVAQGWTSAFVRHFVVHPRARRQGIALLLLNQVFNSFASRHESHVDLKVLESNLGARRLYERGGMHYVQRGELIPAESL